MVTGAFLPPPDANRGRLAPPPADQRNGNLANVGAFQTKPSSVPPAVTNTLFDFGSSDPFSVSAPSAQALDAFGFPIPSAENKKPPTTSVFSESPNLLDL